MSKHSSKVALDEKSVAHAMTLRTEAGREFGVVYVCLDGQAWHLADTSIYTTPNRAQIIAAALNGDWIRLRDLAEDEIEPAPATFDEALAEKHDREARLNADLTGAGRGHLVQS